MISQYGKLPEKEKDKIVFNFMEAENGEYCRTCGGLLDQCGSRQCSSCRAIDNAVERLRGSTSTLGHIGSNTCFDCGKSIGTLEFYKNGKCAECRAKDNERDIESLELRTRLLNRSWNRLFP